LSESNSYTWEYISIVRCDCIVPKLDFCARRHYNPASDEFQFSGGTRFDIAYHSYQLIGALNSLAIDGRNEISRQDSSLICWTIEKNVAYESTLFAFKT